MRRLIVLSGILLVCSSAGSQGQGAKGGLPSVEELGERSAAIKPALEKLIDFYEERAFELADGGTIAYRLFRPRDCDPERKYPLVIFLHGKGGIGTENKKHISGGNLWGARVWALPEHQDKHPCFVLAPQYAPRGDRLRSDRSPALKSLIDQVTEEFNIDQKRLYITGQSMGGMGTWSAIASYPDLFAAAVPVCGRGNTSRAGAIVEGKVAVWAFHGAKDGTVKVSGSREMIAAMKEAGGNPRYTEYPDVMHASWLGAYTDPELLDWLFSQRRN